MPWERTIIYEAHVRGLTMRHPLVPEALRGTFAGLARRRSSITSRALGVTAVELLPIHAFVDDSHLLEQGADELLGLQHDRLLRAGPALLLDRATCAEFKQMVAHLHDAGLEVILDVVYNHTAEGNERGPTLSFKGIDNASYYRLLPDQPRYYINDTGTGNTLNLSHPRVLQMVTDSLRYWATEMHVDGFRFDLATILGREPYGFDEGGGFLDYLPAGSGAEPGQADRRAMGLRPGRLPGRRVPAGLGGVERPLPRHRARATGAATRARSPELASRLAGSADLFNKRGRRPWASVNFVTAHDGFTLNDLVSYNDKHNEANGEDNRDGNSNNLSWNCGVEGPTDDPAIRDAARAAEAQHAGDAAPVPGHADDARRRRVRPHPAGQQQRLLPGQRDQLARLGRDRRRRARAHGLRPQAHDAAPRASRSCAAGDS